MNLATNIQHYSEWNAYLKDRQPKTLVWGRNDPLFVVSAAEFVKQVVTTADLRYFDDGHFVLSPRHHIPSGGKDKQAVDDPSYALVVSSRKPS
jgi:hypothetical protein